MFDDKIGNAILSSLKRGLFEVSSFEARITLRLEFKL